MESVGKMVLSMDEYLAIPQKKRQWLIEPLIPVKGIVNLYGKPKTGKSFASAGMALAITNDLPDWNGFPVRTHGPTMTVQIDTPEGELWDRLDGFKRAGFSNGHGFYVADMDIAPYPHNILLPQQLAWHRHQAAYVKPVLVIIDTLREAHEEDENDSKQMKRVINSLVSIYHPAGAAIALISHSRKDSMMNQMGAESDLMDEARGSSYVSGRMDTVMRFTGKQTAGVTKGTMHYKGRSKGADGKIKITQDLETGLVILEGQAAEREQLAMKLLKDHPDWTINKLATAMHEELKYISAKTAERDLKKVSKLLDTVTK